ncbi:MAG: glutamate synthase central domain-containing protein, partial [Pseudomonadota bacterium]|nr:glutamate synthase central domain-containing protein [Pseudomonadota bacterium]
MTSSFDAAQEIAAFRSNAARLTAGHAYDPADEHDACGVGFVAAIDGKPRREVVLAGVQALQAIWHRGAVDADGKTGDGAGIHLQIPQDFFREHVERTGHAVAENAYMAVGMVFLPRTDLMAQERCRTIVEQEILNYGFTIYGWRQVPVDISVIGEKANITRPEIEQIMISAPGSHAESDFERDLYVIRRRIEKAVLAAQITDFYICSLSCRSIIYKGMFLAEQVTAFYPDLLDERFISNFAIYHQRYSTNTFPTWNLAQPFRVLAHNGEINTVKGNINWMDCHEPRMAHAGFGERIEEIKPVIQAHSSDSAALDAVFELLVRTSRQLPMVKSMLLPEAWDEGGDMPQDLRDLYAYCNAVMEPWDGPAALAAYGGRWILGGMDRNGLRPMRYTVTRDNLLIAGSETGMVRVNDADVVEKGRLDPGQMIVVDLKDGTLFHDHEIKGYLASRQNFGAWIKTSTKIDDLIRAEHEETARLTRAELRQRQILAGWTLEDMELILHPMAAGAKEAVGSMGDDTPLAVLSDKYRGLHHFFRQ